MQNITRKAGTALAALAAAAALAVPMAGPAQAATTNVRLHTQMRTDLFLADHNRLAELLKANVIDGSQRWIRTDTTAGYATYRNEATGRCLTGRSPAGFPVVTVDACKTGNLLQQWRLSSDGDLRLRANGFSAEQKISIPRSVMMGTFVPFQPHQRWHTHPA